MSNLFLLSAYNDKSKSSLKHYHDKLLQICQFILHVDFFILSDSHITFFNIV